jgi:hypothetical protein
LPEEKIAQQKLFHGTRNTDPNLIANEGLLFFLLLLSFPCCHVQFFSSVSSLVIV